jgi:hypothetical protein
MAPTGRTRNDTLKVPKAASNDAVSLALGKNTFEIVTAK